MIVSSIEVRHGDSREVLKALAANSVDSCCSDPPYALISIGKRFGADDAAPAKSNGASGVYARASAGFMGQKWDTGETAFDPAFWREVHRVLKPGGHVLAFSGTRTYHRMVCAIEDAGFEIRDGIANLMASDVHVQAFLDSLSDEQRAAFFRCVDESQFGGMLAWLYGSGFPKSHDVAKGIDKALGVTRQVVGRERLGNDIRGGGLLDAAHGVRPGFERDVTVATSDEAKAWDGWGTALKPALEPIVVARKPLIGTVAENVLKHGTGAINIDACRIEAERATGWGGKAAGGGTWNDETCGLSKDGSARPVESRWPANLVHDGSAEVVAAFPDAPGQQQAARDEQRTQGNVYGAISSNGTREHLPRGDSGSASRFFYTAKADALDRVGSKHPTIKPVDLMRWLVRLVTPKGGLVLDPFAGTGSTGEAAFLEGCRALLIEREAQYVADIERRLRLMTSAGRDERARESIKAAGKVKDAGPLFGGAP